MSVFSEAFSLSLSMDNQSVKSMSEVFSPMVSVIIPHYNDLENLAVCLNSLSLQTFAPGNFEIIVADNNSEGGIHAVERIMPGIIVVSELEQGPGPARNAGAAVARGTHLAFIDSDCVADENWLQEGIASLVNFDYAGGAVIIRTRDHSMLTAAEAFETVFAFNFEKSIKRDKYAGTGNLFVPKAIFNAVGGFRAAIAEDIDWCHRANRMGYRLGYAERAVVYHPARKTLSSLLKRWDRVTLDIMGLAMERSGWQLRWILYTILVAISPFFHSIMVLRSRKLRGLRAKGLGLIGLLSIRLYRSYRMTKFLFSPPRSYVVSHPSKRFEPLRM